MAEHGIGYWLKLVDRLVDTRFDAVIEEHGITRAQWQLMGVLAPEGEGGGQTVQQLNAAIAPYLPGDGSETAADHLGELLESGWLMLRDDHYTLTERGQVAFGRLTEVVDTLRGTLAEGLSAEDYLTTLASLEHMARNLGWQP